MVEGGPGLNHALISRQLVDEIFLTVAPELLGGSAVRPLPCSGSRSRLATVRPSIWLSIHLSGDELFLRDSITRNSDLGALEPAPALDRQRSLSVRPRLYFWQVSGTRAPRSRRYTPWERSNLSKTATGWCVRQRASGCRPWLRVKNALGEPDNARRPPGVRDGCCPLHQRLGAVPAGLAAVGDSGCILPVRAWPSRQHGDERCPACSAGRARGERAGGAVELRSVRPGAFGADTRGRHPGDRFGRRRLFVIGAAIFGAASLWSPLSPIPDNSSWPGRCRVWEGRS